MCTAGPGLCQRHGLAWPVTVPAGVPAPVHAWLAGGGPGVVARRETDQRDGCPPVLVLGVCLPPAAPGAKPGRCAVAWAEPAPLVRHAPPPTLAEALPAAPAAWRPALARLVEAGAREGIGWRVFGSLLWQHLHAGRGGVGFVNPGTSDLDLLFAPADTGQLDAAVDLLAAQRDQPFKVDAEIIFPGGCAVAWQEWAQRPARVLVKHLLGPRFRTPESLREELARRAPGDPGLTP